MELAISIIEGARRAGVSRSSIYEAIGRGQLAVRKCGRRSLVLVEGLGFCPAISEADDQVGLKKCPALERWACLNPNQRNFRQ